MISKYSNGHMHQSLDSSLVQTKGDHLENVLGEISKKQEIQFKLYNLIQENNELTTDMISKNEEVSKLDKDMSGLMKEEDELYNNYHTPSIGEEKSLNSLFNTYVVVFVFISTLIGALSKFMDNTPRGVLLLAVSLGGVFILAQWMYKVYDDCRNTIENYRYKVSELKLEKVRDKLSVVRGDYGDALKEVEELKAKMDSNNLSIKEYQKELEEGKTNESR